jgi:hypothetical protein
MECFIEVMCINFFIVLKDECLTYPLPCLGLVLPSYSFDIGGKGRTGTRYCMANTYHPKARFRFQA